MYYILIREITCLGCYDMFPMVSALVYVMHIRQDLRES